MIGITVHISSDLKRDRKFLKCVNMFGFSTPPVGLEQGQKPTPSVAMLLFSVGQSLFYLCFCGGEC
jgi:hypothetical protein